MEVLGFTETPATVYEAKLTWVETQVEAPDQKQEFFSSWRPSEMPFLRKRIRWGTVATLTIVLVVMGVAAFWIYQRPAIEAARAREEVAAAIGELRPAVTGLEEAAGALGTDDLDAAEATSRSLAVDTAVRRTYDAVARLGDAEAEARTRLIAVTGEVADAARRFNEALAVRSAVVPALEPPALPVDEGSDPEEAASLFADWQARFESLREALPEATFPEVAQAMSALSANLPGHQRTYLDAIATGDAATAAGVVRRITIELEEIGSSLASSLAEARDQLTTKLADAGTQLEELAALFG